MSDPTPKTELREEIRNHLEWLWALNKTPDYPELEADHIRVTLEGLLSLFDTYAAQRERKARIDELMAAEKYASYGVVAEDRWQMFGVYKQDRLTQLKREDGDE